jgi:catechol 2,3-dioxygenase-like lactoylglutathione lyase family enzyme
MPGSPRISGLLRIGLTVADLRQAENFYVAALGFVRAGSSSKADPALAALLGTGNLETVWLRRGNQLLELCQFDPPGAPYPRNSCSNDLWFQHCALVTSDIAGAYNRLAGHLFTPISRHGPQLLPGGILAFKFRDADGHPLELIQPVDADPMTQGGIDHSAISVSNISTSVAFYEDLGLSLRSRQVNAGPAQNGLDGLDGAAVDVVALFPPDAGLHVELLGYRTPKGRSRPLSVQADIAASRLIFSGAGLDRHPSAIRLADGSWAALQHDPDGHTLLLLEES